jgi:translation initiation factor IF-2
MATKKIRVYELARELGVENAVVLELADELKVGVKSHSSSIDEPSADRIRRLADSKGLKREPVAEVSPPTPEPVPEPVVEAPPAAPAPEPEPEPEPAPPPPHRVVRSTGGIPEPLPRVEPPPGRPVPAPREPLRPAAQAPGLDAARPPGVPGPQSLSGKPVPPPPGGGRPIPPPPGGRRGGPPQASFRRTPPPGGDIGAPSAPRGGRPGGGGPPGRGGPGQRRGPGGPQHRPRRKRRRRSTLEELEPQAMPQLTPLDAPVPEGEIVVSRGITIQELAPKLNRTAADLVRLLFDAGEMVTGTQSLADEMIDLIADALGATVILVEPGQEQEQELQALLGDDDAEDDEALLVPRAPVVTVMGHVDHGKTTLLDAIRHTNVVGGEAGGITQHIGAYQVQRDSHRITFIDTPGHEAFTAMRARGAQATDIAVLVVSADDGVMPQTVEAIDHARAAEVPIVVAVTKVDREDADPTRVRQQLSERDLVPEEWGGETIVTDVAAPDGTGIDALLDSLVVVSEVEELKANPKAPARAFVLEAQLEPGRGPVVTALVERGTLRVGDPVVAGGAWGRVRAMFDDRGESVAEAGPSVPVEVLGLDDVPLAGDELRVAKDDKTARVVAEARARRRRAASLAHPMSLAGGGRLEDIFAMVQRGEVATLGLVLKADVQGSLEALTEALRKLDQEHDEVRLSFVHRAVGGITESDVNLAAVSTATIVGFNVRPDRKARELAEALGVDMRLYEVIYQVLEDVNAALIGMLEPEYEEVVTGEAEVREIFSIPRVGRIAGCYVRDGVITRGSKVRFLRDGVVIWNGQIASLKRFKDDVREVASGFECGIGLENYQDLQQGDVIETYDVREIARTT